MLRRLSLLLVVFSALLGAQLTGSVEGAVTNNVTGGGVAGVAVKLQEVGHEAGQTRETTTDASGAFRIDGLAEGDYVAVFRKDGFRDPADVAGNGGKPFRVLRDEVLRLPIGLTPMGALRGRVVNDDGGPVPGSRVQLAHIRGGSAQVATTGDDGRFELRGIGTFTLMARTGASVKSGDPSKAEPAVSARVPTYFPRGILRREAERIVLRPGAELDGYEIRLLTVPVYEVRGIVLNEQGKPAAGAAVKLIAPDRWNQASEGQTVTAEDGTFDLNSVWGRDWGFEVTAKRDETTLKGFDAAVVSNRDVDGVVIRLSSPFTVSGFIERPDVRKAQGQRKWRGILLLPEAGDDAPSGTEQPDGSVPIADVYPGGFHVIPVGDMAGLYLGAVFFGERDVTGQAVEIVNNALPIRIVLKPNPGRLSGTVKDCGGETVVLWGLDEPIIFSEYFHRTSCDDRGRFEFADIRPGDYYVSAFSSVGDDYLLQDLSFAVGLKARATRARVREGEETRIELKMLPWPE